MAWRVELGSWLGLGLAALWAVPSRRRRVSSSSVPSRLTLAWLHRGTGSLTELVGLVVVERRQRTHPG